MITSCLTRGAAILLCLAATLAIISSSSPLVAQAGSPVNDKRYLLGPADQISVHIAEGDDISDKPVIIDPDGYIALNMVGRIHASGMSVNQLETEISSRLKKFYKDPSVTISITEFHSQPVSVLGAVRNPGVHQLQGHKTLVEVISLAGGMKDDAGYTLTVTRQAEHGPIPLPDNMADSSGHYNIAHVAVNDLMSGKNPGANIQIAPDDVITVPRANLVYVLGKVNKSGGFALRDRETATVLVALSLAEGLAPLAAPKGARILRLDHASDKRVEIPVDLQKVLDGTVPDPVIYPEDMLFVPGSKVKSAALRSVEAAIQVGTGVAIYRH